MWVREFAEVLDVVRLGIRDRDVLGIEAGSPRLGDGCSRPASACRSPMPCAAAALEQVFAAASRSDRGPQTSSAHPLAAPQQVELCQPSGAGHGGARAGRVDVFAANGRVEVGLRAGTGPHARRPMSVRGVRMRACGPAARVRMRAAANGAERRVRCVAGARVATARRPRRDARFARRTSSSGEAAATIVLLTTLTLGLLMAEACCPAPRGPAERTVLFESCIVT